MPSASPTAAPGFKTPARVPRPASGSATPHRLLPSAADAEPALHAVFTSARDAPLPTVSAASLARAKERMDRADAEVDSEFARPPDCRTPFRIRRGGRRGRHSGRGRRARGWLLHGQQGGHRHQRGGPQQQSASASRDLRRTRMKRRRCPRKARQRRAQSRCGRRWAGRQPRCSSHPRLCCGLPLPRSRHPPARLLDALFRARNSRLWLIRLPPLPLMAGPPFVPRAGLTSPSGWSRSRPSWPRSATRTPSTMR